MLAILPLPQCFSRGWGVGKPEKVLFQNWKALGIRSFVVFVVVFRYTTW
jgi:hypothetical protein